MTTYDIACRIVDGEAVDVSNVQTFTDANGITLGRKTIIQKFSPEEIAVLYGVWVHKWPAIPDDRYLVSRTWEVVDDDRVEFTQVTESRDPALTNAEVFSLLCDALRERARETIAQEALRLTADRASQPTAEQINTFLDSLNATQQLQLQKATLGLAP